MLGREGRMLGVEEGEEQTLPRGESSPPSFLRVLTLTPGTRSSEDLSPRPNDEASRPSDA